MKILLIGCGNTGGSIAKKLSKNKDISKIWLFSRTGKSSKILEEEIHDRRILQAKEIDEVKIVDYVILALSSISDSAQKRSFLMRKNTYEVRQDELKFNLGSVSDIADDLRRINILKGIIVVTNPVDEITNFLRIIMKTQKVFGFGMDLDSRRYSRVLEKKVLCMGTHGKAIPLLNLKNEKEYDELYHKTDKDLLDYIRLNGIPHEIAGEVFVDFFNKLNAHKEETIHLSYYLKEPFLEIKDISVSLPFRVKKGKILGIENLKVNAIEKKRFVEEVKHLKSSVDHILQTHKKLLEYQ